MTVTVNCSACGQTFQMDVDEEGWKLGVIQNLVRVIVCDQCADLKESKKRSEWYERKMAGTRDGNPF